ncbi:hypothetical protein [Oceanobacter sp. 3_MG-2023]|uniref:hypothetical protein n=1 Tax=Oceanobacter sp. 3_MG-2023 TaxID=3062622 RepID=UPI002733F324|nr:hypothetical protein [Oceanobacter sp. 3_MG-2023]MDP2505380.1 hypothetical protein [Oceanobacter sp. 3_MG-2023]
MISYPATLPAPTRDYSLTINNSAIRTQMESGRYRQRRRFLDSENTISVKWLFTDAEFQLFESWTFHALDGATSWFECPVVSGGGVTTHQVRIQSGSLQAALNRDGGWTVTAGLDVEKTNRMTDDAIFTSLNGISITDLSNQVVATINEYGG